MHTKRKNKLTKWIILLLTAISIILIIIFKVKSSASNYAAVTAKTGNITTYYSFSGNVDTKNRQTILSDRAMQITKVYVKEGDLVKSGTELIRTTSGEKITSNINGEVANLNAEENQQVMGGTSLMDIVDYSNLNISVKVDEYSLSALKKGKTVSVYIDALNKEFKGVVSRISREGQVQNGVTFFPAVIDIQNNDAIRIGMSAEVKVLNSEAKEAVVLPMSVIQFDESNNPYVFIRNKDNKYIKTSITTGINDGVNAEIRGSVSAGEEVFYPKAAAAASTGFPGGNRNSNSANYSRNNGLSNGGK